MIGRATRTLCCLCALAFALACGGDRADGGARPASEPEPATDRPPSPASPAPGEAPIPAAEDTAGAGSDWTEPPIVARRPAAAVATLVEARTARHEGYDRIVLDFGADPLPSYRVAWLDETPTHCGSGEPVAVAGEARLEIALDPARAHSEEGVATVTARDRSPLLPSVRGFVLTCDFEAHLDWVVGLPSRGPVRVFELRDPHRLVVDLAHPAQSQLQRLP